MIVYNYDFLNSNNWAYTALHFQSFGIEHAHSFYEIVIQLSGESINYVNDKKILLPVNSILISKPGDTHTITYPGKAMHRDIYISTENMISLMKGISPTLYDEISKIKEPIHFQVGASTITEIEENITVSFSNKYIVDENRTIIRNSIVSYILGLYIRSRISKTPPLPQWLQTFMASLSNEDVLFMKIEDIIKTTFYSYGHVSRVFKKSTGVTIKEYILNQKINLSTRLLLETDKSISNISDMLNFSSPSAFINLFTKKMSISPNQFRKKNKK